MRACLAILITTLAVVPAQAASPLRVGAAKVDVTPADSALPRNYLGLLDRVYARAIVLNNGDARAALVTVDAGGLSDAIWQTVTRQIETEFGIPATNVLLTATHTHSVPGPPAADYANKIVDAVRRAQQKLVPARVGYGTGESYINVNRQIIDPKTGKWWEGPNREGPSDKTVAVLKFETLSGEPLAVYYNYAVHGVIAGQLDQISGDIPGASSRYIEDASGGTVVAVWSSGAAGDQNPIYYQQTYDLRDIRIKEYAKRGVDISNAMPPGGQGLDRNDPAVARLMNQQRQMVSSMGQFLGEEVLYVMRNIERTDADVRLSGSQKTISCPGRERTNDGRAGSEGTYKDAAPVDIRLGLLRVGDVMIGAVNAEVFNPIAQRLKRESPFKATMMTTLTNGAARSGYIPDDASYGKYTFEVLSSRLRPGCAESSIVRGLVDLIDGARKVSDLAAQAASIQMNLLADWTTQKDTLMKIAAAMPADRFGYKPTPPQRNYGEQILHIAEANVNQMKRLASKETAPVIDMKATSRAVILKALEESFDYGTAVIKEQTDQTMLQAAAETRFDPFRGQSTRARVVSFVMGHTWDIYGQMVVYLRLNGVTPPASQRP